MSGRRWVVDASVAIKWVIDEPDSGLARRLRGSDLVAPELLRLECLNALWRRVIKGEVKPRDVPETLRVLAALPLQFRPIEDHLDEILRLSVRLAHPVYDCAYLALALIDDARVLTADRRFVSAVRRRPELAGSIVLLSETAH